MRRPVVATLLCIAIVSGGRDDSARTHAAPGLEPLLDLYLSGQHDTAVARAVDGTEPRDLQPQLARAVPAWVAAAPEDSSRRRRAAAAFTLEVVHARLETHWYALRPAVEWVCEHLRTQGEPRDGEDLWFRASLALAGRARDRTWLIDETVVLPQQGNVSRARLTGHLAHATDRFPTDPHFQLARVVVDTWGPDQERGRDRLRRTTPTGLQTMREFRVSAILRLNALGQDPVVGAEALVRAGRMYFTIRELRAALESAGRALTATNDPAVRYVAYFLIGQVLEASEMPDRAIEAYTDALRMVPDAQSATLALASLRYVREGPEAAAPLSARAFRTGLVEDPWRLFGYGDYVRWPQLRSELRGTIR